MKTRTAVAPARSPDDEAPVTARRVLLRIAVLALAARIGLEAVGLLSQSMHGEPVFTHALSQWVQWDAHGYLRIAEVGYPIVPVRPDDAFNLGFFPGFPIALRAVATVFRNRVLSGLLVSYVASVFATWFVYLLVRLDREHKEGWRAVLLLVTFPTAYFMAAPYSEALFLCAVTGSIYAARIGRWRWSVLAGSAATASRLIALAVVPALGAEAFRDRTDRRRTALRLIAAVSAASGFGAFVVMSNAVSGHPFRYFALQRTHWYQTTVPPWEPLWTAIGSLVHGTSSNLVFVFGTRLAAVAVAVPLLVVAVRRLAVPDWIYGWAGFLPLLCTGWLTSLPRFLLGLYPIFMVGAGLTSSKRVLVPVIAVGASLQAFLFWKFSVGEWTF